jgi:pimeloyl-ACP methyl ester carboxylesterase
MINDKSSLQCGVDAARSNCPGEAGDCALACADTCAAQLGERLPPIVFAEARERFEREAVHGVCDTSNYRLPYYTWGEGPPLLFVHGVGDSCRSFLQPISRLSAHFRCIAYDLPSGRDGARLRRYSHDDLVADVWALLDHLNLRQSYVLGSSFGATIVLKAMQTAPERLPRGILQGGLAYRPLRRAELFLAYWGRFLPGRMAQVPLREKVLLQSTGCAAFKEACPDVWQYFLDCSGRARLSAFACQAYLLHRLDLRPILPAIRQPVLLICGDQDRVVPRIHEEMLLQGLPNAGRVILEGCGHVPSYTHPELLAEVIRRFLTPAFYEPEA